MTPTPTGPMAELIEKNAIIGLLRGKGCVVEPCGSRVTCDPAPVGTDQDYLVVVPRNDEAVAGVVASLHEHGFVWEGSEHYQDAARNDFMSWRRGEINLIVTADEQFANRHRAATHVCKRLNLMNKADRIALFQAVLYGNQWQDAALKAKESTHDR